MKIPYKDSEIDAFNLIMRKEYAKMILDGKKRVEFRKYSPFFIKMLKDSPIRAIHFHPYNNSWHMDCLIDGIKLVRCDAGGAAELRRDWNSHELDEFNRVPAGHGELTFALHITDIISHSGLTDEVAQKVKKSKYDFLAEKIREEIEARIFEYGLTLEDFTKKELREMAEEIEDLNNPDVHVLDGWFGSMALWNRQWEKRMKALDKN